MALPDVLNPIPDGRLCTTGTVTRVTDAWHVIYDGRTYRALVRSEFATKSAANKLGDKIVANCQWMRNEVGRDILVVLDTRVIGRGEVPPVCDASISEIRNEHRYYEHLRIRGRVTDIMDDDVDVRFMVAVVQDLGSNDSVIVPFSRTLTNGSAQKCSLLHAEVEITGLFCPSIPSSRYFADTAFFPDDYTAFKVVRPAPEKLFDLPPLSSINISSPTQIAALGLHTLQGTVVATWGRNHLILKDNLPTFVNRHHVELTTDTPLPRVGSEILVVGRPATDTFRLNLSGATYRDSPRQSPVEEKMEHTFRLDEVLHDGIYMSDAYGRPMLLKGRVTALPTHLTGNSRIVVDTDGKSIRVDVGACNDALGALSAGCLVELKGICLLETDNWRPDAQLPKIRELVVIVTSPDDIKIVERPSWWTVGKLFGVVCGLVALVLATLVWNWVLNRIVVRRSKQLLREQSARNASELRIGERTRLAVELHDALSQNLVGVACQITAAQNAVGADDAAVRKRLDTAERTLESCRTELRQVLSDLRSDALELPDFGDAVRLVLKDAAEGADVCVRFNVPRNRLLDTTAHAILRIVRELAGNAVRHGAATAIKVAGALDHDRLFFSVRENGTGFDPGQCPGPLQGHFGLEGIRARVKQLGGVFRLESELGKGSYASVSIPLHIHNPPHD